VSSELSAAIRDEDSGGAETTADTDEGIDHSGHFFVGQGHDLGPLGEAILEYKKISIT
jgi:hypothetical protein